MNEDKKKQALDAVDIALSRVEDAAKVMISVRERSHSSVYEGIGEIEFELHRLYDQCRLNVSVPESVRDLDRLQVGAVRVASAALMLIASLELEKQGRG